MTFGDAAGGGNTWCTGKVTNQRTELGFRDTRSWTPPCSGTSTEAILRGGGDVGGRSGTLTRPGHKRALRGTGRRETPADNNQESAGVHKAVPEQRPAVRSFPHVRATRCGNDTKKRPPGKDRSRQSEMTLHCVFLSPRRPAPQEGYCSAPARAAADGAVHRQPPGVPRVKPRLGSVTLRILVSERFSLSFLPEALK